MVSQNTTQLTQSTREVFYPEQTGASLYLKVTSLLDLPDYTVTRGTRFLFTIGWHMQADTRNRMTIAPPTWHEGSENSLMNVLMW